MHKHCRRYSLVIGATIVATIVFMDLKLYQSAWVETNRLFQLTIQLANRRFSTEECFEAPDRSCRNCMAACRARTLFHGPACRRLLGRIPRHALAALRLSPPRDHRRPAEYRFGLPSDAPHLQAI